MEIPGYKIEKLIAEGGMADVFLAVQKSLDRRVALKLLKKFDKPEQSDRFINEGRIIASLYSSNIITIHDIGVVGGQHYISMEYLEGGDLENRIRQGVSPDAAIDLIATIGDCLELVHSKGIVHRDIKPANILFRKDGTPVLTDFGIAKQLNQDTNLTMDGTAMGSPDYLSPEQAACKQLDGRTDIYSLGIVFYEMLMGQKPYQGGSYIEIVMAHISAPIPTLPSHLERYQVLLERMIAKDPEERFDSVADMVAHIDKFFRATPRQGIWAKLVGFVRNLRTPTTVPEESAKTLQIPRAVLTAEPGEVTANEGVVAQARRHAGTAAPLSRRLRIAGVMLVLVIGLVWIQDKIPDEAQHGIAPLNEVSSTTVVTEPSTGSAASSTEQAEAETLPSIDSSPVDIEPASLADVEQETPAGGWLIGGPYNEVEENLGKAKAALRAYKLTVPEKDNAYFYYQKVLKLEPGHQEAKQGMVEIANRYAYLAEREIERYDYEKAKSYIQTGLRVQPGHAKLIALKKRTSPIKDVPKRILKSIESVFE